MELIVLTIESNHTQLQRSVANMLNAHGIIKKSEYNNEIIIQIVVKVKAKSNNSRSATMELRLALRGQIKA